MGRMKELYMEELEASPCGLSPQEIWWMENENTLNDEL